DVADGRYVDRHILLSDLGGDDGLRGTTAAAPAASTATAAGSGVRAGSGGTAAAASGGDEADGHARDGHARELSSSRMGNSTQTIHRQRAHIWVTDMTALAFT